MADTKISALTAASAAAASNELPINEAGVSKKLTVQQIADFLFKRINGSSGAAGTYKTLQKLSADGSVTGVTLGTVMTTTGVAAGTWQFKYHLIMQSSDVTAGIGVAVDHTGTTGQFQLFGWFPTSGGAAANQTHDDLIASLTVGLVEPFAEQAKATSSRVSAAVTNANSDFAVVVEGIVVVTVSGDLQLQIKSETAGIIARVMADSCLELTKIG